MLTKVSCLYFKINASNYDADLNAREVNKRFTAEVNRALQPSVTSILRSRLRDKCCFADFGYYRSPYMREYESAKTEAPSVDILFPFQQYRMYKCFLPFAPAFYREHIARLVHSIDSPTKRSCSLIRLTGNNRKGN